MRAADDFKGLLREDGTSRLHKTLSRKELRPVIPHGELPPSPPSFTEEEE